MEQQIFAIRRTFCADFVMVQETLRKLSPHCNNTCSRIFKTGEIQFLCKDCFGDQPQCSQCFFQKDHQDHIWTTRFTSTQCRCSCIQCLYHKRPDDDSIDFSQLSQLEIINLIRYLKYCFEVQFDSRMVEFMTTNYAIDNIAAGVFILNSARISVSQFVEIISKSSANLDNIEYSSNSYFNQFLMDNGNQFSNQKHTLELLFSTKVFRSICLTQLNLLLSQEKANQANLKFIINIIMTSPAGRYFAGKTGFYSDFSITIKNIIDKSDFVLSESLRNRLNTDVFEAIQAQMAILQDQQCLLNLNEMMCRIMEKTKDQINETKSNFKSITAISSSSLIAYETLQFQILRIFDSVSFDPNQPIQKIALYSKSFSIITKDQKQLGQHIENISALVGQQLKLYKNMEAHKNQYFFAFINLIPQFYILQISKQFEIPITEILDKVTLIVGIKKAEILDQLITPFMNYLIWVNKIIFQDIYAQNIEQYKATINNLFNSEQFFICFVKQLNAVQELFNVIDNKQDFIQKYSNSLSKTHFSMIPLVMNYILFTPKIEKEIVFCKYLLSQNVLLHKSIISSLFSLDLLMEAFQDVVDEKVLTNFVQQVYVLKNDLYVDPSLFPQSMNSFYANQMEMGSRFRLANIVVNPSLPEIQKDSCTPELLQSCVKIIESFFQQKALISQAVCALRILKATDHIDMLPDLQAIQGQPILAQFIEQQKMPPKVANKAMLRMQQFINQKHVTEQQAARPTNKLMQVSEHTLTADLVDVCVVCRQPIMDTAFVPLRQGLNTFDNTLIYDCCQHFYHYKCMKRFRHCQICQQSFKSSLPCIVEVQDLTKLDPDQYDRNEWLTDKTLVLNSAKAILSHIIQLVNVDNIENCSSAPAHIERQLFLLQKVYIIAHQLLDQTQIIELVSNPNYLVLSPYFNNYNDSSLCDIRKVFHQKSAVINCQYFSDNNYQFLQQLSNPSQKCVCGKHVFSNFQTLCRCLNCGQCSHITCLQEQKCWNCHKKVFHLFRDNMIQLFGETVCQGPFVDCFRQYSQSYLSQRMSFQDQLIPTISFKILTHISQQDIKVDTRMENAIRRLNRELGVDQASHMLSLLDEGDRDALLADYMHDSEEQDNISDTDNSSSENQSDDSGSDSWTSD